MKCPLCNYILEHNNIGIAFEGIAGELIIFSVTCYNCHGIFTIKALMLERKS